MATIFHDFPWFSRPIHKGRRPSPGTAFGHASLWNSLWMVLADVHASRGSIKKASRGRNAKICFFCGEYDLTICKSVAYSDVERILNMQKDAGMKDPVLNFCQHLARQVVQHIDQSNEQMNADTKRDGIPSEEHDKNVIPFISCCMCCYHWIARRQNVKIIPLPMQNLVWFMVTLEWCEGGKSKQRCDKRILQRMASSLSKPRNIYRSLGLVPGHSFRACL